MNQDLIRQAADHLNIEGVNLASHSAVIDQNFNPRGESGEISYNLSWGVRRTARADLQRLGTEEIDRFWLVWYRGVAKLYTGHIPEGQDAPPTDVPVLAELTSDFLIQYSIKDDWNPDPEALHEFTMHNTPIHFWPYWREWLQSVTLRMGLPAMVLAMHMLPRSKDVPFSKVVADNGAAKANTE